MDTRQQFENQKQQQERDAISPDVGKSRAGPTRSDSMAIEFSKDELYEINDAIVEVVRRMLRDGQTDHEIELRSLARLWSAWQKVTTEVCGTADTPGLQQIKPRIESAIANPKSAYIVNYKE